MRYLIDGDRRVKQNGRAGGTVVDNTELSVNCRVDTQNFGSVNVGASGNHSNAPEDERALADKDQIWYQYILQKVPLCQCIKDGTLSRGGEGGDLN